MFEKFIHRPVLSLVISLLIVLVGIMALFTLPVTQFPDIVPPSVVVSANPQRGARHDLHEHRYDQQRQHHHSGLF